LDTIRGDGTCCCNGVYRLYRTYLPCADTGVVAEAEAEARRAQVRRTSAGGRWVDLGGGAGTAGATLYGLCGLVMWGRTLLFVLVHRELGQVLPCIRYKYYIIRERARSLCLRTASSDRCGAAARRVVAKGVGRGSPGMAGSGERGGQDECKGAGRGRCVARGLG
jgi:hypothetical protein